MRERWGVRCSICWITLQITTAAGARQDCSQEIGAPLSIFHMGSLAQTLKPSSSAFFRQKCREPDQKLSSHDYKAGTCMGCWQFRQWLNLIYHNDGLINSLIFSKILIAVNYSQSISSKLWKQLCELGIECKSNLSFQFKNPKSLSSTLSRTSIILFYFFYIQ